MIRFRDIEPEVLTDAEAGVFLRIIDSADIDDPSARERARRAINRLVDAGRLRPIVLGRRRRYSIEELRDFCRREVEAYGGDT